MSTYYIITNWIENHQFAAVTILSFMAWLAVTMRCHKSGNDCTEYTKAGTVTILTVTLVWLAFAAQAAWGGISSYLSACDIPEQHHVFTVVMLLGVGVVAMIVTTFRSFSAVGAAVLLAIPLAGYAYVHIGATAKSEASQPRIVERQVVDTSEVPDIRVEVDYYKRMPVFTASALAHALPSKVGAIKLALAIAMDCGAGATQNRPLTLRYFEGEQELFIDAAGVLQ